jgi:hypothetical protein
MSDSGDEFVTDGGSELEPEDRTDGVVEGDGTDSARGHTAASAGSDQPEPEPEPVGMLGAREAAVEAAEQLLTHPLEDVIKVAAAGDAWRVVVEVKERDAVPDTQDMLARYEIQVDERGRATEYGLLERYKRGDMRGDL